MFDSSTQSGDTSFPILESALPTTFDVAAEISFLNPNELSDYFFTPSITHLDATDQVPLSEMVRIHIVSAFFGSCANNHGCAQSSFKPVAAQTGHTLSSSHGRPSPVPPTSTGKGVSGSDCPPGTILASDALILFRDGDDATKLLSTNAAKGPGGTSDGVSNVGFPIVLYSSTKDVVQLSVIASGLTPATPFTSIGITSVDSDRNELLVRNWSDFFPSSVAKQRATEPAASAHSRRHRFYRFHLGSCCARFAPTAPRNSSCHRQCRFCCRSRRLYES
jgi:hypothetical protein